MPVRSGGDYYILQQENITTANIDWTFTIDLWFTDWTTSEQSLFIYWPARTGNPDKMINLYNPAGGTANVFWNNQSSYPQINLITSISNQTWFTLKIQFVFGTGYQLFINNISQGSINTTVHDLPYIGDVLFSNQVANQVVKYRNVIIYEGIVD